jgi:hypothetical protein
MPAEAKPRPSRALSRLSTAELRLLAQQSLASPKKLSAVYFELQFRTRKAARELRDYLRFLLTSLGHPFPWPDTEAAAGRQALEQGIFRIDIGLLKMLGYSAGIEGIGEGKRRDILSDVYEQELLLLCGHPQQEQWGPPKSAKRLQKLANVIASFVRNAKRKRNPPHVAISEWESDLRYLKRSYYTGIYDFLWPNTAAPGRDGQRPRD